jgi:hypothetical protein
MLRCISQLQRGQQIPFNAADGITLPSGSNPKGLVNNDLQEVGDGFAANPAEAGQHRQEGSVNRAWTAGSGRRLAARPGANWPRDRTATRGVEGRG